MLDARRCLDDNTAVERVAGVLSSAQIAEIDAHLDACAGCRRVVSDLTRIGAFSSIVGDTPRVEPEPDAPPSAEPRFAERYEACERIAQGGMGVVFRARDVELDREVALKIVRPDEWVKGHEVSAQVRQEARAMARLTHPNVVRVYDVGTFGEQLFLAMEYVDGLTFDAWLSAAPRSVDDILAACVEAGRGLDAAHRVGLVHRDVKPQNIMCSRDGRVLVTDFGLARSHASGGERTQIAGTPAYMAPEQHQGRRTTPATDQFAFCVLVYEALFGVRPFAGETWPEIAEAVLAGRVTTPPHARHVSSRVRRALLRGLSVAPEARWPSMPALLAQLAPRRRRWPVPVVVTAAGAAAVLAAVAWSGDPAPTCDGGEALLAPVWNPVQRERVRESLASGGKPFVATATRAIEELDAYAAAWRQRHQRSCQATARGEQSARLLDLKAGCLERRLIALRAAVDVLAGPATDDTREHAVEIVAELPALADCDDPQASRPLPPTATPVVEAVAHGEALHASGRFHDGLAIAGPAAASARAIDDPQLLGQALYARGRLEVGAGRLADGEATLREVIPLAAMAHDDRLAAQVWIALARVVGRERAEHGRGLELGAAAQAAITRVGVNRRLEAELSYTLGLIYGDMDKRAEAEEHQQRALALWRAEVGDRDYRVGQVLNALGWLHKEAGEYAEAVPYLTQALSTLEHALGPEHPMIAVPLINLGSVKKSTVAYDEAQALFERALAIRERSLGSTHHLTGNAHVSLANLLRAKGDAAAALPHYRAALSIDEAHLGPTHPTLCFAIEGIALIQQDRGELAEACAGFARSAELRERALGAEHAQLGFSLTSLGKCELARERWTAAATALDRAVRIRERAGVDPVLLAVSRFALAQALWGEAGPRRSEARAMAIAARAALEGQPGVTRRKAEIDAWLAAQPR
ncbi:serine/threonine-protein kinase [Polyangium sp. 6x1]|uniref:serine/threonine-protein kinase n=1 Tax=Polyangium sp. 6x1 TaxID=3042689 RepID=UPI002482A041|nr:serine/threonine-protein kinase [Polyangium sp. 6x1]MDI1442433.1 serine/threonine-protein kinase [Polyangium sp. 6x1]